MSEPAAPENPELPMSRAQRAGTPRERAIVPPVSVRRRGRADRTRRTRVQGGQAGGNARRPAAHRARAALSQSLSGRTAIVIAVLIVAAIVLAILDIVVLPGSHQRWESLRLAILKTDIVTGPAVPTVYGLGAVAVALLLSRRWRLRTLIVAATTVVLAVAIALVSLSYADDQNLFGVALGSSTWAWVVAVFAAIALALTSFWRSGALRRLVAGASILVFLLAGTIGVNAAFGLDRTVADLAGVTIVKPVHLPKIVQQPPTILDGGALWANWTPPKRMPATGTVGQIIIPPTASGFHSRPAGIYLPPAALVPDAPPLPLVIMMMGQPGNPDPSFAADVLNQFAARHHGLAPIVIVPDQLGNPAVDPLCLNTARYGNAQTFIAEDVVGWARTHLHILQDPAHWVVAGYSNGGECALSFGARYPQIWGNVLDISGEAYPGSDKPTQTLETAFDGNRAAYQAQYPTTLLSQGHYPDTVGIFTVGSNDSFYRQQALTVSAAARAAGWTTTYYEVPGGGHVLAALNGGLQEGFSVLYPRLGLSEPGVTP